MADKNKKRCFELPKRNFTFSIKWIILTIDPVCLFQEYITRNEVFINHSLYIFAVMVLSAFFVCVSFIIIGIKKGLFFKKIPRIKPFKTDLLRSIIF